MSTNNSIPTLAEMLAKYPITLLPNNKILCKVTNHEMPPRADVVYAHLMGKKFKKESSWYSYNFDEFLPYIVPHKENNKLMVCLLTDEKLNRIPEQIKKHMSGKRFLRLKAEYEERQAKKNSKRKHDNDDDDDSEADNREDDVEEEEELEIPDNIAAEVGVRKSMGKNKKSSGDSKNERDEDDESEDNLSDLMGSDYGSDGVEGSENDSEDDEEVEVPILKKQKTNSNKSNEKMTNKKGSKAKTEKSNGHRDNKMKSNKSIQANKKIRNK